MIFVPYLDQVIRGNLVLGVREAIKNGIFRTQSGYSRFKDLGMPPFQKSAVFLNIVQKAFDPPPLLFEHLSYFAGGVF